MSLLSDVDGRGLRRLSILATAVLLAIVGLVLLFRPRVRVQAPESTHTEYARMEPEPRPEKSAPRRAEEPVPVDPLEAGRVAEPATKPPPKANPLDGLMSPILASGSGSAKYRIQDRNVSAFFTDRGLTLAVVMPKRPPGENGHSLRWSLEGAAAVEPRPVGELATKFNRLVGDASQWQSDIPSYSKLAYDAVRPGMDLTYESLPHALKYTVQLAAGADPAGLRFQYEGAEDVQVSADGASLEVLTSVGVLVEGDLRCWQEGPNGRVAVAARYVKTGPTGYAIRLEGLDPQLPVTVDPTFSWGSFIGGEKSPGGGDDYSYGVAVDATYNCYVTGYTYGVDFPVTAGVFQTKHSVLSDLFVTKLSPSGTMVWSTLIGGKDSDYGRAIRVDASNQPVVAGYTYSLDFPVTAGSFQPVRPTPSLQSFVLKLAADGKTLLWSGYLGGNSTTIIYDLAIDGSGDCYATGYTYATDFPVTGGSFQTTPGGSSDAFVTKIKAAGSGLAWSSYLGGTGSDVGYCITVDPNGPIFVAGSSSSGFPTTGGAYHTTPYGGDDAFVVKINPAGTTKVWATLIGGSSTDRAVGIALDGSNPPNVYIAGHTYKTSSAVTDYPTTFGPAHLASYDIFVTKFNSSGSGLLWSTYIGGSNSDYCSGCIAYPGGDLYIAGYTYSTDFPVTAGTAFKTANAGGDDTWVARVSPSGSKDYISYLGGSSYDDCYGIAQQGGWVWVVGSTSSSNFNTTPGVFSTTLGGSSDAFVTRFNPYLSGASSVVFSTYLGSAHGAGYQETYSNCIAADASANVYVLGYTYTIDYPTTAGAYRTGLNGLNSDIVVTKVASGGASLVYSTYVGGSSSDTPQGIALNSSGEVYFTGYTSSSNYPTTGGAQRTSFNGGQDSFVTRLNSTGTGLIWSTFLGGAANYDYAHGIALDSSNNVYVVGEAYSNDFPTTAGVLKTVMTGGGDAFVTKLNPSGSSFVWSTFLGGALNSEYAVAVAVDASNFPYVTGVTSSPDFPTSGGAYSVAFDVTSGQSLFLTKLNTTATNRVYSTYLGGTSVEYPVSVAVDPSGQAYVGGHTTSVDFPVLNAVQPLQAGGQDAFVTKFNAAGSGLIWSTYLGGSGDEYFGGLALDASQNVYVVTQTGSTDFPMTPPLLNSTFGGSYDVTATRINAAGNSLSWSTYIGGSSYEYGGGIAVTPNGHTFVGGFTTSTDFPATAGAFSTSLSGSEDLFIVRIDNEAPTLPSSLAQYRSNGTTVISTGGATNETTVILKGLSSDAEGDKYKLQVEVRAIGTAFTSPSVIGSFGTDFFESGLVNSSTTASVTVTGRVAGTQYHWQARSVDSAGVASAWTSYGGNTENPPSNPAANDFRVDTNVPTLNIVSPVSSGTYSTNLGSVAVSGTSSDDVAVFTVGWANAATSQSGSATGTTSWSVPGIPLALGNNVITITATDTAGNLTQKQITVVQDTSAPTVTITSPTSSPTYVTNATTMATLGGTYSDNIGVTNITWSNAANGANGTAGFAAGTFSVPSFALNVGINNITVTAFDAAGNSSVDTIAVTSDPSAPVVTITTPTAAVTWATNAASIVLGGTASDAVTSVASVQYLNTTTSSGGAASGTTAWTTPSILLASGNNLINVTATDAAGNTSFDSITVVLDTQAPSVVINAPTVNPTHITNSNSIALGGTASDPGLSGLLDVRWVNAATSATGTASGTTTWTVAAVGLTSGANSITVTATDNAGNSSTDNIVVTYDPTPPTVTITGPTASPTYVTATTPITLTGTASDAGGGSIQSMSWSTTGAVGTTSGTVTYNSGTGTWSIPNPQVGLAAGSQVITITAFDTAGNSSVDTITVTLDTTNPSLAITTPATNPFYTTLGTAALAGTASDASGITQVQYRVNGGALTAATGTTSWSVASVTLPATTNAIDVIATDGAGNTTMVSTTVIKDTSVPSISISTNGGANFATNTTPLALAGIASDNFVVASVQWQNNGGAFNAAAGTTSWTASIPLVAGSNAIVVRATDGAGATATASITVTLDQTPPTVTITGPTAAPTLSTTASTATISGTYSDAGGGSVTSVNWSTTGAVAPASGATTLSAGTFTSTAAINLAAGAQTITVTATDSAGNTSTDSIVITRDNTAPTIAIGSPASSPSYTTASSIAMAGTASDNNALSVVEYRVLPSVPWLAASGTTSWSVASAALAVGSNTIEVRATDLAGNQATASTVVVRDNGAPTITITTNGGLDFTTNTTPLALGGTATDDNVIAAVAWSNNGGGYTAATGTTPWTASIPLSSGTNSITVRVTDAAGNTGTDTITVTYDSGAPVITVTTPATSPFVTGASTISVLGTAADPSGVQKVEYRLVPAAFALATGTTSWSTPAITLAAGSNTIEIRATDNGNNPATTSLTVIRDVTGPTVAITTPTSSANYATSANSITLGGTVSDTGGGTVATVTWNNPSASSSGTSNIVGATWTATAPTFLVGGSQVITVTATDSVGNISTTTLTVFKDNTSPTIAISSPSSPHIRNTTPVAVNGTADDGAGSGVTSVSWFRAEGGGASGGASGTAAWTASVPLVVGTNTITFTSTDAAGNTSTGSVLIVTLDQTAPSLLITGPTSGATYATNAATVSLSGTVSDAGGGTVTGVTWLNTTNAASGTTSIVAGNWTATGTTALDPGTNVINVTATDSAGNTTLKTLTVTRDNTAPTIVVSSPGSPAVRGTTPVTVLGTADDGAGSGVASVSWSRAEGGGASGSAAGTTSWSASVPLVVGLNTITFTATDAAGNPSTGAVLLVTLDQTGPTIAITTPASSPAYTSAGTITLIGTAVDVGGGTVSTVTWSNAGNATSGGTTFLAPDWTTSVITLASSVSQVITITATDSVGNISTSTMTVVQDSTQPTLTITSPGPGGSTVTTGANPVSIGGSASDVGGSGVNTVTWANAQTAGSGTATGTTSWTASVPLLGGSTNDITITVTDRAGNTQSDVIHIDLNSSAPTITITGPTSSPTYYTSAGSIALSGTSIDDGTINAVDWANSAGGSGSATGTFPGGVNTATPWSVASITLAVGTNTITVTATDNGATTGVDTITVIRDNNDPTISVSTNGGGNFATNASPVILAGVASDTGGSGLASVTWSNAATSGSGAATGTSSWSGSVPLTPGPNVITFTATDGAGNIKTVPITVTYDLTNPAVAITSPTAAGTYQTATGTLAIGALAGTASDASGITLVQVQLNGGAFVAATGTTAWSNSAAITLAAGVNSIVVRATDGSGNMSTTSLSVTFDNTLPTISISSPASGLVTNASPIILSGVASDNLAVASVTWTNTLTAGSGTATGTTSWTATGVALAAGVNPITVTATDTLGNIKTASISVTYDATVPTLNITTPATTTVVTNLAQITLSGSASDNIAVASVTASNAANSSTGTPSGTTSWSVASINLIAGTNVITVTATDTAGNITTKVITVTRDNTAPAVAFTTPTSGPTYLASSTPLLIAGTSSDNVAVASVSWVNSAGGSGSAAGTTSWSASVALTTGTNTLTVTATDTAGNTQTAVLTVTYDNTLPMVTITTPAGSTFATNTSPVALAGTASDSQGIASVAWSNAATGGSGTATGTLTWSTSVPLAIGVNVITVTATDGAGNPNTAVVTVTLDTTVPNVTITGPTASPTYVTAASSIAVSGTTSDNISVASISWSTTGGVVPSSGAVAPSGGTWSIPVINLAAGAQDITITATDTAGNTSTDTITVTRDNTLPTILITSPSSTGTYITGASTLIIGGTAADNVAVTGVSWSRLESPPVASGAAAGTTSWSATVPLLVGLNTFSFQATDGAGNLSTVATIVVTRDNTVPSVMITGPTASPTFIVKASPVALSGTATDADGIDSVTWTNAATGGSGTATYADPNWSGSVPLAIGVNTITVTATDTAGNTSTDTLDVTLDVTAPVVTINSPTSAPAYVLSGSSIDLAGTASDNVGLASVTAVNAANSSTGTPGGTPAAWSVTGITLVAGANVITVTVTDTAGNTATDILTVTSDGTPPAVQITGPTAQPTFITNVNPLSLSGTASDNLSVASVAWSNSAGGSGAATGTAVWSASVPLTAGVANTITVTVTDTAGGTSSAQIVVTYDNVAPAVAISAPTAAATYTTNVAPLLIGGTASDVGGLQSVAWSNAGTGGTGLATGTAAWSASIPLVNGLNVVTMTATDIAGNTATDVLTVTFDAVLPTVTINAPTSQPTHLTSAASIALGGTSADNVSVASVSCVNAANGAVGVVTGTVAWTVAPLALVAGDNPITVTVTDTAGNTNTDTLTITADFTPPVLAFTLPTSGPSTLTNSSPLAIGGTASDNVGLLSITWSNPSVPASGSATGTGAWSAAVPISGAGVNTITVTATDLAGNIATTTLQVTLDTTDPTITTTGPTNQPTYSTATNSVTVSGTASDAGGLSTVTWVNGATGATGTATGTSSWSAAVALTPGINVITITAVDAAGNLSTSVITVIHDTQSPTITISIPTSAANYNSPTSPLTVGGNASDNVGVTAVTWTNGATGGSGTAVGTTSWSADVPLAQGNNQITVTAVDNVGNSSSDTITVSYDPTLPNINITTPTTSATYSTTVTPLDFAGTASDNLSLVDVTWANLTTATTGTASGTTTWTASIPLTSGPNTIVFTATDSVGNIQTDSIVVTYDITPPVVVIVTPAPPTLTTQTRPLAISGTASDNVGVVNVTWSNSLTGSSGSATFADPNWSATIPLIPGSNVITIRASDALGNIGSSVLTVDYSHETVAPALTIVTPAPPSFVSPSQMVTLAGTASDNVGVSVVQWINVTTGVYGIASGTTAWTADVPLANGANLIQVMALDDVGNSFTDSITISYAALAEVNPPTITITAPTTSDTFDTTVSPLHIEADALDDVGIVSVHWTNQGSFGDGDSGWGSFWYADIPLVSGINVITMTAIDTSGNTASDTITINYNPPVGDPVPPAVSILTPLSSGTYNVTVPTLDLAGISSDNNKVDAVTFSNNATGVYATATGTTSWSVSNVALNSGVNVITARAIDPAGNIGQTTLVVVYTPPAAAKPVAPVIPAGMCGCTGLEVLLGLGAVWMRRRRRRRA